MTRASDTAKLLGAGATILDGTTISTADNTDSLTLQSTDADANVGPVMLFKRDSSSPAASDFLGYTKYSGENNADEETIYAQTFSQIVDVTNGSEDGTFAIDTMVAGTLRARVEVAPTETVFNEDSVDLDFRVESNGNANMLFVDGGNDGVAIGHTSSGGATFAICDGANSAIQFFPEISTDTNLIQHYDQTATAYMNSEHRANSHIFKTGTTERMRIPISDDRSVLSIGDTTVYTGVVSTTATNASLISMNSGGGSEIVLSHHDALSTSGLGAISFNRGTANLASVDGLCDGATNSGAVVFRTVSGGGSITESMRISGGNAGVFIGKTSTSASVAGMQIRTGIANGNNIVQDSTTVLRINRQSNDGTLVDLMHANNTEGTISISGGTVSYNAFSGSHWSRLSDNSKPTILVGTVIETIDEMCDWYQAEFIMEEATEDTPEITEKVSIALPDGKSVGDTMSITHEGITYDNATLLKENDKKHTKCKISDTADSTRVYGVYTAWDNDDDAVNDMYVTAVGTSVVRINNGVTVSAGDLLASNGDGTAKVQDDDIIRSKTIGKVLTNIKQETYDDGSYTVPCALYCG